MPKPRINIHVSEEVAKRLHKASWQSGIPKSGIVDTALAAFLSGDLDDRRESAIVKRLDRLERVLIRLDQNCDIVSETLALFVLYYLTATTPLPPDERKSAEQLGQRRFDRFVDQVIERIRAGKALSANIISELMSTDEDHFMPSDLVEEDAS